MVGGAMIGPQNTSVRTTLGPLLNGLEYWAPVPKLKFPGVQQMMDAYQEKAARAGVDLLSHYMAPLAYARMQVVAQAIEGTGGFDDAILSTFASEAAFNTVMVKFGKNGEWAQPRVLQVQFEALPDMTRASSGTARNRSWCRRAALASGELIFPYAAAL